MSSSVLARPKTLKHGSQEAEGSRNRELDSTDGPQRESAARPESGNDAGPSIGGSTEKQPNSSHYTLKPLVLPGQNQMHYIDIVAVHDFDETVDSWVYRDREEMLRQEIDRIKIRRVTVSDEVRSANKASRGAVKRLREVGSSTSSSSSRHAVELSWLEDRDMLPRTLPGARVFAFSYPKLDIRGDGGSLADYIDKAASGLLCELARVLKSSHADGNSEVNHPIVMIGAGLGGIIVQRSLRHAVAHSGPLLQFSLVEHVAEVIFLDTPFPRFKDGAGMADLDDLFPIDINVRMRVGLKVMGILKTQCKQADVVTIWNEFWRVLFQCSRLEARVLWFYSAGRASLLPKKRSLTGKDGSSKAVALFPLHSPRLRRLSSFQGPDDPNYKQIMTRLSNDLMLRSVRSERLRGLQRDLMRAGFPVDAQDEQGLSLLHHAVAAVNPSGVNLLLGNRVNPLEKDTDGQTPLHCAIRMFCDNEDEMADEAVQTRLITIIEQLLSFMTKSEIYNSRDNKGVSPYDVIHTEHDGTSEVYGRIQDLLHSHRLNMGNADSVKKDPWADWGPPYGKATAEKACEQTKAIVAEFYTKWPYTADYEVPSVLKLIYDKEWGPTKILSRLEDRHPSKQDVCCRWIHIPANNEQWLHDLFIRLRIEDNSMTGQRQSGHTLFSRYMSAQAKRYKQERFLSPTETRARHLDIIQEDGGISDVDSNLGGLGFMKILEAEGEGWPAVPLPRGLEHASDTIVLFMPVLAYEQHRERKIMSRALRKASKPARHRTSSPWRGTMFAVENHARGRRSREPHIHQIDAYIHSDKPLHCRRTLDQYSYYMMDTTEPRDLDQIVYKWARNKQSRQRSAEGAPESFSEDEVNIKSGADRDKPTEIPREPRHRPVIMVDQLWLWVLPNGTVVTSLPNTADPSKTHNIQTRLKAAFFDHDGVSDSPVHSVNHVVQAILNSCVGFFEREGPCGVRFRECFQSYISEIAADEANMYREYKRAVKFLRTIGRAALSAEKYIDIFSEVTDETERLIEIMDIQDELKIINSVLLAQSAALQMLVEQISESPSNKARTALRDGASCARDAVKIVKDQILSVREMADWATRVQDDLKELLAFKQQQSDTWDKRFSRQVARQGQEQNNTILVFTIVTLIFLPMSFISSFFALEVNEFPKDAQTGSISWPLNEVSSYLFGISIAVSFPMIIMAFGVNPITRAVKARRNNKRFLKRLGTSAHRLGDHDSDYASSDDDDSDDSGSEFGTRRYKKTIQKDEEDDDYAPLFGRRGLTIHTKIPLLRRLWEYKVYRLPETEDSDDVGLTDLEWDYPLSRCRKWIVKSVEDALSRVGLGGLARRYADYIEKSRLERESDELIKELILERRRLEEEEAKAVQMEKEEKGKGIQREGETEHQGVFGRSSRTGTGLSVVSVAESEHEGGPGPAFRRMLSRRGARGRVEDEENGVDL